MNIEKLEKAKKRVLVETSNGLETETAWIRNNPQYYHDEAHQELVIKNITYRYKLQAMSNAIDKVLK